MEEYLYIPVSLGGMGKTSQQQPGRKKNVTWNATHASAGKHTHRAGEERQQTRGSLESTPLLFSLPVLKVQVACQQCGTSFLRKVEWSKCFACILSCRIMVPINCHFMEANWTMVQKVKEKKRKAKVTGLTVTLPLLRTSASLFYLET